MGSIHAVFENGIFRPTERVELPDQCEVEFEPKIVGINPPSDSALEGIYAVLSERYESGESDVAARHDEHQP